ncbi:MAG: hypothetical protein DHS20C18_06840 [Saprospiraceae bacterium]|nr:MAG: hypothetical protein DHS20C18_06840 [Saprospiraceae bacterium]
MRHLLFILLFVFIVAGRAKASISADSTPVAKLLGLKLHQGFVLVHSRHLRPIRNSYPTGLAFDLAWHKTGQKAWNACHCYPKLGVSLSLWDYDHPDILGHGLISMFYLEPVFGAWRTMSFSIRAAAGFSYQTKPYDEISNPNNLSYSTYIAVALQLGANLHIRLYPHWNLDITTVYNHFSNGGIKLPNKGINWPTAAIGVTRYFTVPNFQNREKKDWRIHSRREGRFEVSTFLAFKEPVSKLFLFSPGLEVKYSRQVSRLSALTLGAEWMYDNGTRYAIELAGRTESPQKGSLAIGHEFLFGKFIFSQQFGFYLYKPYRQGADVYQRYGLIYRISPRFFGGINLKAHRHVADFADFRLGMVF